MPRGAPPKGRRIGDGTFAALLRAFQVSDKFTKPRPVGLSDKTKENYRYFYRIAEEAIGHIPAEQMRPSISQAFFDGFADRPAQQRSAKVAFKSFEKWAIVRDHLDRSITTGTEVAKGGGGNMPWSNAEVKIGEDYAPGHLSRMVTLAANTGQRGSDLVKMRWSDLEEYEGRMGINVTQQKTGVVLWIPVTIELTAAMKTWERRLPDFLMLKADGMPWTRPQLSNQWAYHRDQIDALAPLRAESLSMHGLRGTACVRLRRAGLTSAQIAGLVGMSEAMVNRYCRLSMQRENAVAAMNFLEGTTREPSALIPFPKRG